MHNQMIDSKLKSVALMCTGYNWELLKQICERLKNSYGTQIHLYAISDENIEFYKKSAPANLISSYTRATKIRDYCTRAVALSDRPAIIDRARINEKKLGTTYNQLAVANRHLGRGFALAGFYHPRSIQSEDSDYWSLLNAYNQEFDFWEREVKEKNITLFLQSTLETAVFCRANNISYRVLCNARYKNWHYWGHNQYYESPSAKDVFQKLNDADRAVVEFDAPFLHEQEHRLVFDKNESFYNVCKRSLHDGARYFHSYLRNYELGRNYYLTDTLAYRWRRWSTLRRLSAANRPRLADLKDIPFVFFPLHTEPESAVQQMSPEFFFQHAAIAAIARDLPAGVPLVVKETIHGMGRRPDNFYDAIMAIKNVIFLNVLEKGLDIVKKSSAVATITGTAGFEAAVLGRPVLSFGQHNVYNCVPHVYVIKSFDEIKDKLSHLLSDDFNADKAKIDGSKFLKAIEKTSFDLGQFSFYKKDSLNSMGIEVAYNAFISSLERA